MKPSYRWAVLAALTLLYFASNGYGYLSLPTFYPSLAEAFGVEKGIIPQTASIMTLIMAFLSPLAGYFLDRFNPRWVISTGILIGFGAFFYFTKMQNVQDLRIFYGVYALCLVFGGLGPCIYLLNQWFDKNRGIAVGIFLNASSLGAAFFNPYIGSHLKTETWEAVATHNFYILAVLLILPLFFLRGKRAIQSNSNTAGFSLKEIFSMPSFWLLIAITCGTWFCINSVLIHKDTFLNDLKLDAAQRGQFGGTFFLCGVIGKLLFGFLSDRFDKKAILLLSIVNILVATFLLWLSIKNPALLPIVAVVYGIGYSGSFTIVQILIADYYFGKAYGTVLGLFIMADTLAGTVGVYLLGALRNSSGNYESSFLIMLAIGLAALLATFFVKKPVNQ